MTNLNHPAYLDFLLAMFQLLQPDKSLTAYNRSHIYPCLQLAQVLYTHQYDLNQFELPPLIVVCLFQYLRHLMTLYQAEPSYRPVSLSALAIVILFLSNLILYG